MNGTLDATLILKAALAGGIGMSAWLFGLFDGLLQGLVVMVVLDVVTGVVAAYVTKTLSSDVSFRGIARKVMIFTMVAVAVVIDRMMGLEHVLRTLVIAFYIGSEGLSILENAVKMNVPIPPGLKDALARLQKKTA